MWLWWWWRCFSVALGGKTGQLGCCEACCWNADPCSGHQIKVIIITITLIIITFINIIIIIIIIGVIVIIILIFILHRGGYTPLMLAGQQGKLDVYNLLLTTYRSTSCHHLQVNIMSPPTSQHHVTTYRSTSCQHVQVNIMSTRAEYNVKSQSSKTQFNLVLFSQGPILIWGTTVERRQVGSHSDLNYKE